MSDNEIPVAEMFYSIQGEGRSVGFPAVFLRLAYCNLSCGVKNRKLPEAGSPQEEYENRQADDATWVCDTLSVWTEPDNSYEPAELLSDWRERGFLSALRDGAHLILTGGEPTLPASQRVLIDFLELLEDEIGGLFVEVETNGTIVPTDPFAEYIDQFNVSLKLSNSGMSEERRLDDDALEWYASGGSSALHLIKFKFVVSREEDIEEIKSIVDEYDIPDTYISLMPAGATQEQLRETYPLVAELAKENRWEFSPRLQIDTWNTATGV